MGGGPGGRRARSAGRREARVRPGNRTPTGAQTPAGAVIPNRSRGAKPAQDVQSKDSRAPLQEEPQTTVITRRSKAMSTQSRRQGVNPWVVMVVVSLGFFMTLLDTTIVNIAIPSIIDSLRASLDEILWVLNAYTLVYAVLLITSGRLGDRIGPQSMFLFGAGLFTAASVLCGLSTGPTQLIAARALQGLGGAIMGPQVLS